MARHLILIGMMGSGKSTVAPIVAAALKREVIEVDALIEAQEGMPIGEIFIAKGEAYFRRAESAMMEKILQQPPGVISPGGGAFQWDATRDLLLKRAVVIYLSATEDVLASRLQSALAVRPLLNTPGLDVRETIRELLTRRAATYNLAHYRVDTSSHTPEDVAQAILLLHQAYE